jgi:hypothetical protein
VRRFVFVDTDSGCGRLGYAGIVRQDHVVAQARPNLSLATNGTFSA